MLACHRPHRLDAIVRQRDDGDVKDVQAFEDVDNVRLGSRQAIQSLADHNIERAGPGGLHQVKEPGTVSAGSAGNSCVFKCGDDFDALAVDEGPTRRERAP